MYYSTGILKYGPKPRIVVFVDKDLAAYYRSFIPKSYRVQAQKYPPHITVVRSKYEEIKNFGNWKRHDGEKIEFSYSGIVNFDGTYFYLDVQSKRLGDIRDGLGMPRFRFDDNQCYHITIGNMKNGNH